MNRSTIIMIFVFLILGLSVFLVEKPFTEHERELPPELGLMFPDFDRDTVTRMEFGSFGGSTVLVKEADQWQVMDGEQRFPADEEGVDKVLETLESMEAREIISKNPQKHIKFQVNSPQSSESTDADGNSQPFQMGTLGTEVILSGDGDQEMVHLFVGKNGSVDFMTTYVRKEGSPAVVLVEGYLKTVFGKGTAANWKDRTLSKVEPEQIKQVVLGLEPDQIILESYTDSDTVTDSTASNVPKWKMIAPRDGKLDSKDSDRLVNMFRRFLATDYAEPKDDPAEYGFEAPAGRVELVLHDDSRMVFLFGAESPEKANHNYVKVEGEDRVFVVPKYRLETVQRQVTDFFPETPSESPGK